MSPSTNTSAGNERPDDAAGRGGSLPSRDADLSKGATEDERPSATTNAPGLDDDGLPNDETAIAEDALGARADGSQG
jgi:hypothetical protein